MATAFRRFYLYSALSIAVVAIAVAVAAILGAGLAIVGPVRPPDDAIRSRVAFTIAVQLVAVPVGAAHYLLIRRDLRQPEERSADVRHFYLNLWILGALVAEVFAMQALASATEPGVTSNDWATGSTSIAAMIVAAAVGLLGWRWRDTTPPRTLRWETDAAYVAMVAVLLIGLPRLASAVDAAARLLINDDPFIRFGPPPGVPSAPPARTFTIKDFYQRQIWSGTWTFAAALIAWGIATAWQWRRQTLTARLRYLVAVYSIGFAVLLSFADLTLASSARYALGHIELRETIGTLSGVAVGVVLVALHAPLLRRDRGPNGHPAEMTDRLLASAPAIVGLALIVAAAAQGWTFIVDHALALGGTDDPADHAAAIGVSAILGVLTYPLPWRTLGEPSAVRRFALFTIVCLSLLGGVIAASAALFELFNGVINGSFPRARVHDLVTWAGLAVIGGAVFVWHLLLLRRERRATMEAVVAPPHDPLLDTLEAVARGELTPAQAAGRIRAS